MTDNTLKTYAVSVFNALVNSTLSDCTHCYNAREPDITPEHLREHMSKGEQPRALVFLACETFPEVPHSVDWFIREHMNGPHEKRFYDAMAKHHLIKTLTLYLTQKLDD